ncbi:AAA family ATPase [Marine Group III euryarchaeote]|nr:AAA family ATPase [Marine Group III euryarchaeote]
MNIEKIEIENFRQYNGKIKFDFDNTDAKNISIVLGVNGAGKSNLYNAVTWCLYGIEEHRKGKEGLQRLNESVRESMAKKTSANVKVKITFGGTSPMQVERTQGFIKTDNGLLYDQSIEHKVWYERGGNWESSKQPTATVNSVLPKGIRQFFFFDGEQLDDFFKPGLEGKERIEESINDVSGINIVDKTLRHLEVVQKKLRKETGTASPQLEIITKKMNDLDADMEGRAAVIVEKKKQKAFLEKEIIACDDLLKTFPSKNIGEYQKNRETLEKDIKRLKKDLEKLETNRIVKIVDNGPYVFAMDAYKKSLDLINAATDKGQLPPGIRGGFVRELLDKGLCICGQDIEHSEDHRKKVESLLREEKWDRAGDLSVELKWKFETRMEKVSKTSDELVQIGKEMAEVEALLEEKQMELKEISEKLQGVDSEKVAAEENKRREFVKQKASNDVNLGITIAKQGDAKDMRKELDKELLVESRKYQQLEALNKKLDFATRSLNVLTDIRDEYISEIKDKISENTNKYFQELIWKKTFEKVTIDDEFDLKVYNNYGSNVKYDLSAGERQVLALSFMAALKDITGYKAPVLIDTPMGRISKKPKDNIAECLPRYLKDTQLILLVTDSEYTTSVKEKLDPRTANCYKLNFDEETSSTTVVAT